MPKERLSSCAPRPRRACRRRSPVRKSRRSSSLPTKRELLEIDLTRLTYGTFSIAACDLGAGQWGVATQSKFLAVGSVVPWAEPHVGAVATQAYANPRYGPQGLELLRQGLSAEEVVQRLTEADEGREHRQLGVVDAKGRGATLHGLRMPRTGPAAAPAPGYAAQGNILVSGETVDAIAETFESSSGPLAERLIDCLAAAQAAGGDSRGQQSAALLVVETDGGYAGLSDVVIDLRVDDHKRPIEELRRLYGHPSAAVRQDAELRLDPGGRRPARGAARTARQARLREPVRMGGRREPRGATWTARTSSTPSSSKS